MRVACAVVALFALGSCGRTAGLRRAYMSLDSQGNRQRDLFFVDSDQIYCVGEVTSGRANVTVTARIKSTKRFDLQSNSFVPYEEVYAVGEDAPGKTDLKLSAFLMPKLPGESSSGTPPQGVPYTAGVYACELSIDGEFQETIGFTIAYPGCPAIPVVSGATCAGWVLPNSQCPAQIPGQQCVCGAKGTWECQ